MQPFADAATQTCPYCGEEVEVDVDSLGASAEAYVEDCPVCCRPWEVKVTRDEDGALVTLGRDDD